MSDLDKIADTFRHIRLTPFELALATQRFITRITCAIKEIS
jgi:hypothetical protein